MAVSLRLARDVLADEPESAAQMLDQLRDTLSSAGLTLAPVRGGSWTLAMNGDQ